MLAKDRFDSGAEMTDFTEERPVALSTLVSHNRPEIQEFSEFTVSSLDAEREQFVEPPACRNRSGKGAITGVLLGAGLWTVILVSLRVIKL